MVQHFFPITPIKPYADLSKIIPKITPTPTPTPVPTPTYIPYPVPTTYPSYTYNRPVVQTQPLAQPVQKTAIDPTLLMLGGVAVLALLVIALKK